MTRSTLILILLIITSAVLGFYIYLNFNPRSKQTLTNSLKPTGFLNKLNQPTVKVPIGLKNKSIKSAKIVYGISASIKGLKNNNQKNSGETELITNLTANEIPKLVVNSKTPIFFIAKNKRKKALISDLKVGQKIIVNISYALKVHKWNAVSSIFILPSPSATPSPVITKKP